MKYNKEENTFEFTQIEILRHKALKLSNKKPDLTIKILSKAISLKGKIKDYKGGVGGEKLDVAECYAIRADIYFEKKDYDKAMADYAAAAKLVKWTMFYEGVARCYEKKKDWDAAIAYYTKGIRYGIRSGDGRTNSYHCRGRIYLEHKKNYDKAISDLKKAIKDCWVEADCKDCLECEEMIAAAIRRKND